MKKRVIILVLFVLAGILGWRVYSRWFEFYSASQHKTGRAVAVTAEPVQRKTLFHDVEFAGALLPRSQFVVAPKVSGRLEKLSVNMGDEVRYGDLIATLDSEEYEQQIAQAQAELDVAQAMLMEADSVKKVAENDLERVRKLHEEQVASAAQLDEVQARYQTAAARVEVARAQIRQRTAALKSAEARLAYTRLHAVWERPGRTRRIAERFADEGTMLRANDPVVSVIDTESLLAVIYIVERDFPVIVPGQTAILRVDAYPNDSFEGRVARRAPALDEQTLNARVEIDVPNPDEKLASGMFVRVVIRLAERIDVAAIPISSVVRRNGEQGVFLADTDAGVGRFISVNTGVSDGDWIEILAPEIEWPVITLGHHLLEDGTSILLHPDPAHDVSGRNRKHDGR